MLMWIASLLTGREPGSRHLRQRHGAMSLHGLALMVKQLILLRAADIAGLKRKQRPVFFKHGRDLRRRHLMRSIFGAELRRALNHRDPIARIAILIHALTHLDAWAARFAKRLRCGFMRLWSIAPEPMPAIALVCEPALVRRSPKGEGGCADSS
jgi:hypothetical protein